MGSYGTANSVASSVLGGSLPGAPAAGEAGAQSLTTAQAVEKLVMVVAKLDMVVQQLNASGVASIGTLPLTLTPTLTLTLALALAQP